MKVLLKRIKELYLFEGLGKVKVDKQEMATFVRGIDGFEIGDTIADFDFPGYQKSPLIATMSMLFTINDSPFFGREGVCYPDT